MRLEAAQAVSGWRHVPHTGIQVIKINRNSCKFDRFACVSQCRTGNNPSHFDCPPCRITYDAVRAKKIVKSTIESPVQSLLYNPPCFYASILLTMEDPGKNLTSFGSIMNMPVFEDTSAVLTLGPSDKDTLISYPPRPWSKLEEQSLMINAALFGTLSPIGPLLEGSRTVSGKIRSTSSHHRRPMSSIIDDFQPSCASDLSGKRVRDAMGRTTSEQSQRCYSSVFV